MTIALGVILGIVVVVAAATLIFFRRQLDEARRGLAMLLPWAVRGGVPEAVLGPIVLNWKVVLKGGNLQGGAMGPLGLCPCQHDYTVATNQIPLAAIPNAAQVAAMLNYPPDAPAVFQCPEDCVLVKTRRWRGWMVVQNVNTGAIILNCHSFAQYHCKKPGDPDREKPPEQDWVEIEA